MACVIWNKDKTIKNEELVEKIFENESLTSEGDHWIWSIKNKYYSCKVKISFNDKSSENVGASIWTCQKCLKSDIENLKRWQENLPDQVEVQLLIVDEFENEEAKNEINQWAIQNGVEIIDFSEDQDLDSEEQVEIFAKNSQKRCVESLQTVIWTQFATEQDESCKEESEMEDFENLFANLVHFKETATGLPDEERRKFAEKVALSFYSALGEDDD